MVSTPLVLKTSKKRKSDGNDQPFRNSLLAHLPSEERNFLSSKLTLVNLELNQTLQEADDPIEYCYFFETAVGSIVRTMKSGKIIEVGMADKDGFVGLPVVAGLRTSSTRVVVQTEGTAWRLTVDDVREATCKCPELVRRLFLYSLKATMELEQIAACNKLHGVKERLARWLLMYRDRSASDELSVTHEFLSEMLGTRRPSITNAASTLQKAGVIRCSRAHVKIINREGLEAASCECYEAIQQHLARWRTEGLHSL